MYYTKNICCQAAGQTAKHGDFYILVTFDLSVLASFTYISGSSDER